MSGFLGNLSTAAGIGGAIQSAGQLFNSIGSLLGSQTANAGGIGVDSFASKIASYSDLASTNRFMFMVQPPPLFYNASSTDYSNGPSVSLVPGATASNFAVDYGASAALSFGVDIPFFCKRINMPSLELNTVNYTKQGYGVVADMPVSQTFEKLNARFYCDNDGQVLNFFQNWFKNIVNLNYEQYVAGASTSAAYPFEFSYRNEYATNASLVLYNTMNQQIMVYYFDSLYPIRVGGTELDWSSQNSILEIPVTFTYKAWRSNSLYNALTNAGRGLSLGQALVGAGTAVSTIASIAQGPLNLGTVVSGVTAASGLSSLLTNL